MELVRRVLPKLDYLAIGAHILLVAEPHNLTTCIFQSIGRLDSIKDRIVASGYLQYWCYNTGIYLKNHRRNTTWKKRTLLSTAHCKGELSIISRSEFERRGQKKLLESSKR